MSEYIFKLPDLGEGTVEAEIAAWHVTEGATVNEDDPLVDMMTDKAAVEVASPVSGTIKTLHGEAGAMVAVGSPLVTVTLAGDTAAPQEDAESAPQAAETQPQATESKPAAAASDDGGAVAAKAVAPAANERVLTSPSIRRMAREQNIDLTRVKGSGPQGRILREDVQNYLESAGERAPSQPEVEEIKVIGLRRIIAQRMSAAKRNIPHFSYVEEVDITQLEALRQHLNAQSADGRPRLTYLPLICKALARALAEFPQCNARYDAEREVIARHRDVHIGVATQTEQGLKVPVVRNVQSSSLWEVAEDIVAVSARARDNTASRAELTGSTITVTSLGKLGGIVTTPVINDPEVAILGINKAVERPMVIDGQIQVRLMMNLSGSFDHRFVDGYDAAAMIQRVRELLEQPAAIFIPD